MYVSSVNGYGKFGGNWKAKYFILPATSSVEERISVWKSGASAETSHLKMPEVSLSTSRSVTSLELDLETWKGCWKLILAWNMTSSHSFAPSLLSPHNTWGLTNREWIFRSNEIFFICEGNIFGTSDGWFPFPRMNTNIFPRCSYLFLYMVK